MAGIGIRERLDLPVVRGNAQALLSDLTLEIRQNYDRLVNTLMEYSMQTLQSPT